jgi:drug/metabolite transporter (DMT)-like permease
MDSVAALAHVIVFWSLFDGSVSIVRSIQLRGIVGHWWALLLGGIVSVAFGVAALYYFPGLSLTFAVLWTAYWLIVTGLVAVYISFQERSLGVSWGWTLTFGIVAVAGGVVALMNPQATLATLLGVIAGFSFISGVVLLIGAGRMQSFQGGVKRAMASPARA